METFKKETSVHEVSNLISLQGKISCPKYINHYYKDDKLILEMEKIEGDELFNIIDKLNDQESKIIGRNIIAELKKLRKLEMNIDYIVEDVLLGKLDFKNEEELNEIAISRIRNINLRNLCRKILPKNSRFVLSHGDFHLGNILVKKDLSIVIIDWANLNYLPEYWDPMKFFALFHSNSKMPTYIIEAMDSNPSAILCHKEIIISQF